MSSIQFFVPKGTRKSGKPENPNPTITIDPVEEAKAKKGVDFNKAACSLVGIEGESYLAFAQTEEGVFFTLVDEETVKNNSGNFLRIGKNGHKGSKKSVWELIYDGANLEYGVAKVDEGVFQVVPANEATNPVGEVEEEVPVVEEEVEETTQEFEGF